MIGIVVVSHSHALAEAAVALAAEMVSVDSRPSIAVAAGLDETTFGTDAMAISAAIEQVDSPDGVLVFLDLGSAILSAEMALEFVDPDLAERVTLTSAPLIEGLVAAVVTASTGASVAEVDSEAKAGLLGKQDHLGDVVVSETNPAPEPDTGCDAVVEHLRWTIRNPHGLHARPAALLVAGLRGFDAAILAVNETTGAGPVPMNSLTKVTTLGLLRGHVLDVSFSGPQAREAQAKFLTLAADDFGEAEVKPPEPAEQPTQSGQQIVIGPAVVVHSAVDVSGYVPGSDEEARLSAAFSRVDAHLQSLTLGEQGAIFAAQGCLLQDVEFRGSCERLVAAGESSVVAVSRATQQVSAEFAALSDPYLRERAEDVRSIGKLLLLALVGEDLTQDAGTDPSVLVLDEIDASTATGLDPRTCLGVVTVTGGATGHGVIVASSKGIPVLAGRTEAGDLADGDLVAFDPVSGELWLRPSDEIVAELRAVAEARVRVESAAVAVADLPAVTQSGVRVLVEANVAALSDAGNAVGADGSGLVRTEILFGDRVQAPSAREQADVFVEIGRALGGPITIRTWDVGGDKPLPFLPGGEEANPFLGERGIRMMPRVEQVFREQLRGIALASLAVPVRVLLPMVTTPDEVRWARQQLDEVVAEVGCDPVPLGIMVEVPAVAIRAADFTGLVDFVSVGTNDLTQYTMAADRGNAAVSALAKSDSDAIYDLIRLTASGLPNVSVAVCGDLASKPELASTLIGLGVTELSVRPPLVPLVKAAVRATP